MDRVIGSPSVATSTTNVASEKAIEDDNTTLRLSRDLEKDENLSQNENPQVNEEHEVRSIQGWRWLAVCISVYSTALLYGLDTTIAANIQANAVETFGAVEKLAWLGTGFSLGSIAVIMFV